MYLFWTGYEKFQIFRDRFVGNEKKNTTVINDIIESDIFGRCFFVRVFRAIVNPFFVVSRQLRETK